MLLVLVAEGPVCKLGDFGESKDLREETMTAVRTNDATPLRTSSPPAV